MTGDFCSMRIIIQNFVMTGFCKKWFICSSFKFQITYIAFHVYYFPQGELPYDMGYKENGLFINKFGAGFFDEAGKSQMDIIRRVKEEQHV